MASFSLRALARDDLEVIWDYTVEQWGVEQAERYLNILFTCFEDLAANPLLGRQRDDVKPGYQSFSQGRQVVFYVDTLAGVRALRSLALFIGVQTWIATWERTDHLLTIRIAEGLTVSLVTALVTDPRRAIQHLENSHFGTPISPTLGCANYGARSHSTLSTPVHINFHAVFHAATP